eukprot:g46712.t1
MASLLGTIADEPTTCQAISLGVAKQGFINHLSSIADTPAPSNFVCNDGCDINDSYLNDGYCDCKTCTKSTAAWPEQPTARLYVDSESMIKTSIYGDSRLAETLSNPQPSISSRRGPPENLT